MKDKIEQYSSFLTVEQKPTKSLETTDYLAQIPLQDRNLLSQKRLAALKANIEKTQALKEKEKQEQESRQKFISGLLGA
ncbi:MAG: hypothetical protein JSS07_11025 [Proteobacteria bacterium]|nr:hypothetical protein [Pseudomonadota bacterium]